MTKLTGFPPLLVLSVLLAAGCKTMTGETAGHQVDDTTITTAIKSKLAVQDRAGSLTRIGVKTEENTVYLTGTVPTVQEKNQAEDIASHEGGVKNVVNNIQVQP